MIDDRVIQEKIEELLAGYVNDDSYLNDALCNCFVEVRALYSANTIDDKLAAIDAFQTTLSKVIKNNDLIVDEAWDCIKNSIAWGE